jgi:hypothetical protein
MLLLAIAAGFALGAVPADNRADGDENQGNGNAPTSNSPAAPKTNPAGLLAMALIFFAVCGALVYWAPAFPREKRSDELPMARKQRSRFY